MQLDAFDAGCQAIHRWHNACLPKKTDVKRGTETQTPGDAHCVNCAIYP
jgi:hypothetical protein